MAILDQAGRPIETARLTEPQTARIASLQQSIAGHPAKGLTPLKLAAILESAEAGDVTAQFDLFEDMEERDAHLYSELDKRKRALLTLDWDVLAPRDASAGEKAAAAYAAELVHSVPDIEDVILDAADAIGKGFACLEIEWAREGREWLPRSITHRPQRWFALDQATRSEIRLADGSGPDGAPLTPFGWIVHTHRAKSGYITRSGLMRVLAWPYLFKHYSVRDLAEFIEIYGLPLRVGKYPPGASDEEKATLLRAVVGIGHNAAGIMPEGMAVEFQEAAKGTHEPYQAMLDWCERSQSKAIVGQVLSAEAKSTGLGSGVADLQGQVRDDILASDATQIASTLTRALIWPLLALNGRAVANLRRCPRFAFDTRAPEDLQLYAEALPKLVGVGMRIPAAYAHEKLKIPQPQADEPVLAAQSPDPAPAQDEPTRGEASALRAALRQFVDAPDTAQLQAVRMEAEAGPALDAMIDTLGAILDGAETLEQARAQIAAAFARLPSAALADALARGGLAAELAGRSDVAGE